MNRKIRIELVLSETYDGQAAELVEEMVTGDEIVRLVDTLGKDDGPWFVSAEVIEEEPVKPAPSREECVEALQAMSEEAEFQRYRRQAGRHIVARAIARLKEIR